MSIQIQINYFSIKLLHLNLDRERQSVSKVDWSLWDKSIIQSLGLSIEVLYMLSHHCMKINPQQSKPIILFKKSNNAFLDNLLDQDKDTPIKCSTKTLCMKYKIKHLWNNYHIKLIF